MYVHLDDLTAKQRKGSEVVLCVERRCTRSSAQAGAVRLDMPVTGERTVAVRLTVRRKGSGRVLLERRQRVLLRKMQPNGSACPPTCYVAVLRLDRKEPRLQTVF